MIKRLHTKKELKNKKELSGFPRIDIIENNIVVGHKAYKIGEYTSVNVTIYINDKD